LLPASVIDGTTKMSLVLPTVPPNGKLEIEKKLLKHKGRRI